MHWHVIILVCFLKLTAALNTSVLRDGSYVEGSDYGNYFGEFDEDYQVTPQDSEDYEGTEVTEQSVAHTTTKSSQVTPLNRSRVYFRGTLYDDYGCSITTAPFLEPRLALFLTLVIVYYVVLSLREQ
uniref:Uncharacterized protein n=1 Tax=Graphocephala atropunctata TaxID=36148 RepID=A0A1B6KG93_9HEMI